MMTYAFVAVLLLSSLHTTYMRFFLGWVEGKSELEDGISTRTKKKRKPLRLMVSIPRCNLAMKVSTSLSLVQCSPQPMRSQFHCDSDAVSDLTVKNSKLTTKRLYRSLRASESYCRMFCSVVYSCIFSIWLSYCHMHGFVLRIGRVNLC